MNNDLKSIEKEEFKLRDNTLSLIASENYCSEDILDANGSIFVQVYSEGFPNKRYYEGCEIVDQLEQKCIDACLKLFNAEEEYYANVQPNSGSSANLIAYNAILNPNDVILAPDTASLGHISHSHPKSFLAKYHQVETYGVGDDGFLNYDDIEKLALKYNPKLIIAGASNYSREIDCKRFKQIADKVGAYYLHDMAHTNIFHAHGLLMSPVGYADIITSSSHKALGSTRSGFILYRKDLHKQMCTSTIPTCFGGPLNHLTYAKLVGFEEAMQLKSKVYSSQVFKNAKAMANVFNKFNIPIITGGTDNHLCTIDLTNFKINGKELADMLHKSCNLTTNANAIPRDTSFLKPNGVRFGTCAITKRGLTEAEVEMLITAVCKLIVLFKDNDTPTQEDLEERLFYIKYLVMFFTREYPLKYIYPNRYKYLFGDE